ncbi:IS481 family transposase [Luteibacter rhizovicinus]|nr:IS481 family transposase [Luteibacter rhizovicinus]
MPWKETTAMSLRAEFLALAKSRHVPISQLALRFGISRKTAHKWLRREAAGEPVSEHSRRPRHSPCQTSAAVEAAVVKLRLAQPAWGGRTLSRILRDSGQDAPPPSTVNHILRRHGLLGRDRAISATHWHRFEHPGPNDLWQMDHKGPICVGQRPCSPLTVLDDHSRYNLILKASSDLRGASVKDALTEAFRRYGLPLRMNMDNGSPWGIGYGHSRSLSTLALWLVRLGIHLSFSAPFHPQTNGKIERFHRTLKVELLSRYTFTSFAQAQLAFDRWRDIYNGLRPHQGINMDVPVDRYQASPRAFPEVFPEIEYAPDDQLLKVAMRGRLRFKGRIHQVSVALSGYIVAARPHPDRDSVYDLYFSHHRIGTIDLNEPA